MNIKLRKMTTQEYDEFFDYSSKHHAAEIMKELNMSFDEAALKTESELKEMLPGGLDTPDNSLMIVEDMSDGRTVGYIWYLYEFTDGIQQAFICDFVIQEQERQKGYATAALCEMEKHAKSCGCEESVLFVANENVPAKKLYTKCGYVFDKDNGYGMFMKKKL